MCTFLLGHRDLMIIEQCVHIHIQGLDTWAWAGGGGVNPHGEPSKYANRKLFQTNSDIYTGWVYDGRAYVTDRFAYGRQSPAIDPPDRQDIYQIGGRVEDDIQVQCQNRFY